MTYKEKHPPVRLTQIAFEHLTKIVIAEKEAGRSASNTSIVSSAILALPVPGYGSAPCEDKEEGEK